MNRANPNGRDSPRVPYGEEVEVVKSGNPVNSEDLRAAGLEERAIISLGRLKQSIATGQRDELTRAHKYLLFGKYLVGSGRLNEGAP